ncbi:MAG: hypothetical protein IPG66_05230 [Hydrogenophilales bacterium]|nr:hypothetical protein [Hydrogenophilales bacterium]
MNEMPDRLTENPEPAVRLGPADIVALSSPYLGGGRKLESWRIEEVLIVDDSLTAVVSMDSVYLSGADGTGFHLSFITAMEFVSQLQIIHMHAWAGLREKTREVWMLESGIKTIRPVRDRNRISVESHFKNIRKQGETYYSLAKHSVTDSQDGLFEIWIKALLS